MMNKIKLTLVFFLVATVMFAQKSPRQQVTGKIGETNSSEQILVAHAFVIVGPLLSWRRAIVPPWEIFSLRGLPQMGLLASSQQKSSTNKVVL